MIDRVAELSGVHHPVVVLPRQIAQLAQVRDALGLPGPMSAEGYSLMAQDWRFSSRKAERELGYRHRPLDQTLRASIEWYTDLIQRQAFADAARSPLSTLAAGTRAVSRLGLLGPVKLGQRIVGRRMIAGV